MTMFGLVPEGVGGLLVTIEAQVNLAIPVDKETLDLRLLGLPQTALRQGVARWRNALKNTGLPSPGYEVTINLAPAGLPKEGTTLEAPIVTLLGIFGMTAEEPEQTDDQEVSEEVIQEIRQRNERRRATLARTFQEDWVVIGELRLSGELKSTHSLLGMIAQAPEDCSIIVPQESEFEASLLLFKNPNARIYTAQTVADVVQHILGEKELTSIKKEVPRIFSAIKSRPRDMNVIDISEIAGQDVAKRAMEIAVAGGHSVLLYGPPGEGKTMLARAIPGIMPPLTKDECFEINQVYSAKGLLKQGQIIKDRPFRQVHTTATKVNLIGGIGHSAHIEPGEISLAHHGVLFLDELPQFSRDSLESLRAPLAEKRIVIGRADGSVEFMCNFALVAAMNPCLCGYYGEYKCSVCHKTVWKHNGKCEHHPEADTIHRCQCTKQSVASYMSRLSGPFMDRIDLKVRVLSLNPEQRFSFESREDSRQVRARIVSARRKQSQRYAQMGIAVNSQLDTMQRYAAVMKLSQNDWKEYEKVQGERNLSTRGAVKVLQVARTIADLDGNESVTIDHILQAMGYMGSSFNELDIQIECGTSLQATCSATDPIIVGRLSEKILYEVGRRRLSKSRCATEMGLTIPTFNKVLRGESNISATTMRKIAAWLNESAEKSFGKRHR